MRSKILLLCIFIPVLVNAGAWPFYGHDTLRTGVSPYKGPKDCAIICSVEIGYSKASPVIDGNGNLYIQGENPFPGGSWYLWCVNTSDCSVNWRYYLGATLPKYEFQSSCGISPVDGTIYVGYESALYAIKPDSTLKWSYPTGGKVRSSPAVASDGTIYVGCDDNYLYAINPDSTLKWKYQTGGALTSSPAMDSKNVIYIGSADGKLYAIRTDSTLKWSYATGGAIESSPAIGSDRTIYVGSNDDYLHAINPDSTLKWKYNMGGDVKSSPAVDNVRGVVYVGSNDDKICAIDTGGGFKWETPLLGNADHSSPAVAYPNNIVYIGAHKGATSALYAIDGETGNIICTAPHKWEITSPAIDDPANNGGNYCVWYNEWCEAIYKICSPPAGTEEKGSCVRDNFHLHLYPNPLVAATKISFTLPVKSHILLEVYDISGRLIKRLAKGSYDAGEHTVEWNADGIRKGIYFCKLERSGNPDLSGLSTESQTLIRKMILLRKGEKR